MKNIRSKLGLALALVLLSIAPAAHAGWVNSGAYDGQSRPIYIWTNGPEGSPNLPDDASPLSGYYQN